MHIMFSHKASVIRFATFLAPQLYGTYEHIARYVGRKVGYPSDLTVGRSFEDFRAGRVDVGFICGLPYVRLADAPASAIELLAAPVLQGERYRHKPVYFSDVIVRSDSPYSCFDDLSGCTWAYNEATSHSGYNLVVSSLLDQGKTLHYFGTMVKTGSHSRSLQLVLEGRADAAAIDSHVLDVVLAQDKELALQPGREIALAQYRRVVLAQDKELALQLRVVTMLGPSSIPPVVVARSLDPDLKCRMREALLTMHNDPDMARVLHQGRIDHFVAVKDDSYNDIRTIFARTQAPTIEGCRGGGGWDAGMGPLWPPAVGINDVWPIC